MNNPQYHIHTLIYSNIENCISHRVTYEVRRQMWKGVSVDVSVFVAQEIYSKFDWQRSEQFRKMSQYIVDNMLYNL